MDDLLKTAYAMSKWYQLNLLNAYTPTVGGCQSNVNTSIVGSELMCALPQAVH